MKYHVRPTKKFQKDLKRVQRRGGVGMIFPS